MKNQEVRNKLTEALAELAEIIQFTRTDERTPFLQHFCAMALSEAGEIRDEAAAAKNENIANEMLSYVHCFDGISKLLLMNLLLHTYDYDLAWIALWDSYDATVFAQLAHPIGKRMLPIRTHLLNIEHVIFPPQLFCSPALQYGTVTCSVCEKPIDSCEHIERMVYFGKRCFPVIHSMRGVDETSFMVDLPPKDKRCRVVSYTREGTTFNWMTRRPENADPVIAKYNNEPWVFEIHFVRDNGILKQWSSINEVAGTNLVTLGHPGSENPPYGKTLEARVDQPVPFEQLKFAMLAPHVSDKKFFIMRLPNESAPDQDFDQDTDASSLPE